MVQFRAANLRDVVSRPAVTGKPIYASVENAFRFDTKKRIEQLNDFFQAKASNQAGSTAPTPSVRGELWADTSTAGAVTLYVDPDGEGYDDNVARRLTAKNISFKTGGTATFKLGGAINVNTTQTVASSADLMSYTIPANTINDGGTISIISFGSNGGLTNLLWYFDGSSIVISDGSTNSAKWAAKCYCVRIGSSRRRFTVSRNSRDDTGDQGFVQSGPLAATTFTSDIISKFTENTGSGTQTQEIMLTRLLQ